MKMKKIALIAACAAGGVLPGAERRVSLVVPTRDIAEFEKVADLAVELGADHVWATETEPSIWIWDRDRSDPYPNWGFSHATVFKYVVPEALRPYMPADYAKRNFDRLAARGRILRQRGLKASFTGNEPAYFPEEAYRAHPKWRGPRCDQARRARHEYYSPCVDNPEVREMYFEAVKTLCTACPFDSYNFLSNDSGGGFCWAQGLYAGENGPADCRAKPIGERIAGFLSIFQEASRAAGCGEATAGVYHIGPADVAQTIPCLKPGQMVNGIGLGGTSRIGFGIPDHSDETFPVRLLPRLGMYARQMQSARAKPAGEVSFSFRSIEDQDAIDFVRQYKDSIGAGPAARGAALEAFAAGRVGKEDAVALAEIWEGIEEVVASFAHVASGGHVFELGSVHQRWLTRPFVAYPEELEPDEKDYYRAFIFQAQEESNADDMMDLQGNRWLGGNAAGLFERCANRASGRVSGLVREAERLAARHGGEPYGETLRLLVGRLKAYRFVIDNAKRALVFQAMMDRSDRYGELPPESESIGEQGDVRLLWVNQLVRDEIDACYDMADEIDRMPGKLFETAPTKALTTVMRLEPDLSASLRRKAVIMENHRRDFLRFLRSYNR